jgi:hypothetical protein
LNEEGAPYVWGRRMLTIQDFLDWKFAEENLALWLLYKSPSYSYEVNALLRETGNKLCAHPLIKSLGRSMLKLC